MEDFLMSLYGVYQKISSAALVVKHTCQGTDFGWEFWREKKKGTFQKTADALLKKQYVFQRIILGTESISTGPNDVLSEIMYYFDLFLPLKARNPAPNRHAGYSPVDCDTIRIASKNETKQTRHHRNTKLSLLMTSTLNKQV